MFVALIVSATLTYLGLAWLLRCDEISEVYGIAFHRDRRGSREDGIDRLAMMDTTIHVFLSYLRVEKGLAQNTILAYGRDLKRFSAFLAKRQKQRGRRRQPRRHRRFSFQSVQGKVGQPVRGAVPGFAPQFL